MPVGVTLSCCLLCSVGAVLVAGRAGLPLTAQTDTEYIVTATPADVGVVSQALCIAVNPLDQHRVWWWEPGASGCSTRSTGPGIFHAEQATVSRARAPSAAIEVGFRMQLHSRTSRFAEVLLVLEGGSMSNVASDVRVPAESRRDLDVPESR